MTITAERYEEIANEVLRLAIEWWDNPNADPILVLPFFCAWCGDRLPQGRRHIREKMPYVCSSCGVQRKEYQVLGPRRVARLVQMRLCNRINNRFRYD